MSRPLPHIFAAAALLVLGALPVSSSASPASQFVDTTLSREADAHETPSRDFNPRQLPLLMASLTADPPADVDRDALYRALARWHFWSGRTFDTRRNGLWTTGATPQQGEVHLPPNITLSTGAAFELVELSALARMAFQRGHVFDTLVWWHDHLELRERLAKLLYDPMDGAYSDLDSLGRRSADARLSGLVPIALGARHGGEATRLAAWRLWTGAAERVAQDEIRAESGARMAAENFESWSTDLGLHIVSNDMMAALSLQALDNLDEPVLSIFARDALAARGMNATDSIRVTMGDWDRSLDPDDLRLESLERTAATLRFMKAIGVYAPDTADSLLRLTGLPRSSSPQELSNAISILTDALVELRGMNPGNDSGRWSRRRGGADDLDPGDRAAFDFQWSDLRLWFDRALDLMTADILAWHLRPDYDSDWQVALDPSVVGHGDHPTLQVHARRIQAGRVFEPGALTLMWTDGMQLLPPFEAVLNRIDDRNFECEVPPLPRRNGLWQLVVEGLPDRPRMPAAVSVVDPVIVSVLPVERRGSTVEWAVHLRSQIQSPLDGRVDLETPLSWTSAPATSMQYRLAPGGVQELKFSVTPDRDVAPGAYPLSWTTWSSARLVAQFEGLVDQPFSWLRVGALKLTTPGSPIDSRYSFDRQIDLAQRVDGVEGKVAWTKLPMSRVSGDGFVTVAPDAAADGIHYAFTAFVTQSRESVLEFESEGPARVFVNGRRVISLDRWGGRREVEVDFVSGTNYVVVKLVQDERSAARFRMRARDIDGLPLRGMGNELELLVENYAYLARARQSADGKDERQTLRLVPIRFENTKARSVSVVGSFNGWSPSNTPMTRGQDGSWQVKIRLRPGRFEYKFAVDGDDWVPDPANPDAVEDGFGGRNSVLVVD
jgi:hypothetical protein